MMDFRWLTSIKQSNTRQNLAVSPVWRVNGMIRKKLVLRTGLFCSYSISALLCLACFLNSLGTRAVWLGSPPQFFKSECQLAILSVESLGEEGESQSSTQLLKFLPAPLMWLKCGQFTSQNLKLGNFCILSSSNKLESWWHFPESVSPAFILFSSRKLCNVDAVPFTAQKKCTCLPVLWTFLLPE